MPRTLEALDEAVKWLEKFMETHKENAESAIDKAEQNLAGRLERIDLTAYVTKSDFDSKFSNLGEDVRFLREAKAELSGKASQQSVIYLGLMSATALAVAVLGLILRFYKV